MVNSRIIIRISDKRVWHSVQENLVIFSKNIYIYIGLHFRRNFLNITFLLTTSMLLAVEGYFVYQVEGIDVLYYFRKKGCRKI